MAITASRRSAMPQRTSNTPRGPRAHRLLKDPVATKTREINMRDPRPAAASGRPSSLTQLQITGWRKSKFSSNPDGGVSSLTKFIERRGTIAQKKYADAHNGVKKNQSVRIRKSKVEGDALIISVATEDVKSILSANGYEFGGINIKIELLPSRSGRSSTATFSFGKRSPSPIDTGDASQLGVLFKGVLARRYNLETKILDLSNLGQDPDLNSIGIHDINDNAKFFPALMKVCDEVFTSREQKEEAIMGIILANNKLKDIVRVTVLAQTFQDLKNLDLSGNEISKIEDLSRWKFKFKKLEHIILTNNPIEQNDPTFKRSLARQFPKLRQIDLVPIPAEDLKKPTPPKVQAGVFKDEGGIAEQFLQNFFQGYDNDRSALVQYYYDADSTFSYAVNMKSLRDPSEPKIIPQGYWREYTRESRNLTVLNNPIAKMERAHRGVEAITKIFNTLPASKHPDFATNPEKWIVECQGLPGLPDPTGASPSGVNGLRITMHGQFEEVATGKRMSFDRSFILGPGGPNQVRVVNDMMTIRSYGGFSAYQPEVQDTPVPNEAQEKEAMVMELSRLTGMNAQYSFMCLEQVNFVPADALAAFESAKANIPPEAFVQ